MVQVAEESRGQVRWKITLESLDPFIWKVEI
jgi:hypothetical protein